MITVETTGDNRDPVVIEHQLAAFLAPYQDERGVLNRSASGITPDVIEADELYRRLTLTRGYGHSADEAWLEAVTEGDFDDWQELLARINGNIQSEDKKGFAKRLNERARERVVNHKVQMEVGRDSDYARIGVESVAYHGLLRAWEKATGIFAGVRSRK